MKLTPLQRGLLIAGILFAMFISNRPAQAHDWYTGIHDPVTGGSCCGGSDCGPVPLDADWVQPTATGYHVKMTMEETRTINPNSNHPLDTIIPYARALAPPSTAKGPPALYHICIEAYHGPEINSGGVFCLFAVPGI